MHKKTGIDLFSGTKSFGSVAKEFGIKVFSVDNKENLMPSVTMDISNMSLKDFPEEWHNPFIVWASPPCTKFSIAGARFYWDGGHPNKEAKEAIELVKHTIGIIFALNPKFWYIENPTGMLRTQNFMKLLPRRVNVTYCAYGFAFRKPTDIWTNNINWKPRPMCKNGDFCHISSPRGSKNGIQSLSCAEDRAVVPAELIREIIRESISPSNNQEFLGGA